jgi:hypothetical protein
MCQVASNQLKTSYQKVDKPKIKKKHMSSALSAQHWDTSYLNVPTRKVIKQNPLEGRSLSQRRCFGCKEKGHNIVFCLKEEASKQVYQNWTVWIGKPEYPISVENFRTSG